MATKVVVVVNGGNVQDCFADTDDIDIEIIDFDNIKEEGADAVEKADARLREMILALHHIY